MTDIPDDVVALSAKAIWGMPVDASWKCATDIARAVLEAAKWGELAYLLRETIDLLRDSPLDRYQMGHVRKARALLSSIGASHD